MNAEELRSHIGEALPDDGEEEDTLFMNTELDEIIGRGGDDFNTTLAYAWASKAGRLAHLVDLNEDGSDRKLSQSFKNAKAMMDAFMKAAGLTEVDVSAFRSGAFALGFNPWGADETTLGEGESYPDWYLQRFHIHGSGTL